MVLVFVIPDENRKRYDGINTYHALIDADLANPMRLIYMYVTEVRVWLHSRAAAPTKVYDRSWGSLLVEGVCFTLLKQEEDVREVRHVLESSK